MSSLMLSSIILSLLRALILLKTHIVSNFISGLLNVYPLLKSRSGISIDTISSLKELSGTMEEAA